jgi:hypothetical protein
MRDELNLIWDYIHAVFRHWLLLAIDGVLVLTDIIERTFTTWLQPPLWVKVTIGVGVLIVAQYLAYRDLRQQREKESRETEALASRADALLMEKAKSSASKLLFTTTWISEQLGTPEQRVIEALRLLKTRGKVQSDSSETGWTIPIMRRLLS